MSFVNQGIGLMDEKVYALIENLLALFILLKNMQLAKRIKQ